MRWYTLSALVACLFTFTIGFTVYRKDRKSSLNQTFFLMCLSISIWNSADILITFVSTNFTLTLVRISYIGAFYIAPFFLKLIFLVTDSYKKPFFRNFFLLAFLLVLPLIVLDFTPLFLKNVIVKPYHEETGQFYFLFILYFCFVGVFGLGHLFKTYYKIDSPLQKIQLKYIFLALLTLALAAFAYFLSLFDLNIPAIHFFVEILFISIFAYAIVAYHLMDITLVIKTYGLFVLIYFLLLVTLLLFGIFGREWLMTIFPHYWWLGLMLSTMVIAIAGHIVANYFKRRSELEITTEMEVRSNKERFILLGQLIGGIAHNMKTPIMAMGGWVAHERELITEYEESLGDKSITEDDYREIAKEMREGCTKVMTQLQYMTEVIDTIRGQAMELQDTSRSVFDIRDLVKRVDLLLESELRRNKCFLRKDVQIDEKTVIAGEVSNLVQVLANLINNAMHAYQAKGGEIIFHITKDEKNILIMLQDFGVGIPERVQKDLFQTMVTTKGKFGTGLGLLMSKSTIKARFDGNITFTSKEGEGSTFCIHIPLTKIVPLPA